MLHRAYHNILLHMILRSLYYITDTASITPAVVQHFVTLELMFHHQGIAQPCAPAVRPTPRSPPHPGWGYLTPLLNRSLPLTRLSLTGQRAERDEDREKDHEKLIIHSLSKRHESLMELPVNLQAGAGSTTTAAEARRRGKHLPPARSTPGFNQQSIL